MTNENKNVVELVKQAKSAYLKTMCASFEKKNEVLEKIRKNLIENKDEIFEANKKDLIEAQKLLDEEKINKSTFNRLKLNEEKFRDLILGLEDLIKLDDPNNKVLWEKELDKDLILKKVSCPIGVIGVIFEARPDCFIQISSLIIKSGNCGVLNGGSECINTNKIFFDIVKKSLSEVENYPENAIISLYSRDDIKEILKLDLYIDLIIPRGSNKLVKYIKENTKIPVLGHSSGICHIYLDEKYDLNQAKKIIIDAKTQYPSACNSIETLLINKNYPYINELLEGLKKAQIEIIENPENYETEYGDKILAIKKVNSLDAAIEHINKFGSGHTDCILSENKEHIEKFMNFVDSSSVYSNCSTRFADGFRYGFGAEVGISTNKTHARGPVGLDGLTIYKYKLFGSNNIVQDYVEGKKSFTHKLIN